MLDLRSHVARIVSSANQLAPASGDFQAPRAADSMAASWRRCMDGYRFDPGAKFRIEAVSDAELKRQCEANDELIHYARPEIDALFGAVSVSGFSISLGNVDGYIITERANYHPDYYSEVERPGTAWAEPSAGTNAIGTCLVERRPVGVLTNDHFFYEFSALSCASAPLFGPDAELIGAINISIRNPELQRETLKVVLGLSSSLADRIGERMFRQAFRRCFILKFAIGAVDHGLIAVDGDFQLVGLNHAARDMLRDRIQLARVRSLWAVFERDHRLADLSRLGGTELTLHLQKGGDAISVSLSGPLEAPAPTAGAGHRFAGAAPVAEARPRPAPAPAALPPRAAPRVLTLDDCAGGDARMAANVRLVRRVLGGSLPILLLGETGVGKDAFARAIHEESPRRAAPFVAFNCASVPDTLIDSELFGYGSGAFTGARREGNAGRLVEADGGTLFLDEIGDMPVSQQTRLLHVLESGEVTPLGTGKPRRVDLQVIAATNQNLEAQVARGQFRQDLYYRLAGAVIDIPALRARSDRRALIENVLASLDAGRGLTLSPEALALLMAHDWPGNVRELRHALNRAVHLCEGTVLGPADIAIRPAVPAAGLAAPPVPPAPGAVMAGAVVPGETGEDRTAEAGSARHAIACAERDAIVATLARCGGNVKAAAAALQLSRATLYRKLQRYRIVS
ncbi:sigma-54-dependent Fis family transcriptional regulator [Ancylobacter rudongensis]|uniref:Transcriptional regulator of acetoin/glycerol metabolism n=1 Tax=Ancylobacter rudongensis TaxID=177413 RepID=A0A1G4UII3_9HYPH|nr:sigma-54-dependent Fis family transcriptional regulator [Ancylobacter rudongensis]SCW93473.1 Transcriptional regulator of acetoin/glycerol metabolism [Ancylobacter rudongensis]